LHKEQGLDISIANPGDEVVEEVRKIYKRLHKRKILSILPMMVQLSYVQLWKLQVRAWLMIKSV
jgi:hypothetical protein